MKQGRQDTPCERWTTAQDTSTMDPLQRTPQSKETKLQRFYDDTPDICLRDVVHRSFRLGVS
jgi:hypothetical protein